MHMNDMVTIDTIVFKIVGEGGAFKAPPPRIVNILKYPGSDRVNTCEASPGQQVNISKLHKIATCNWNFEKSLISDMHYPTLDI